MCLFSMTGGIFLVFDTDGYFFRGTGEFHKSVMEVLYIYSQQKIVSHVYQPALDQS